MNVPGAILHINYEDLLVIKIGSRAPIGHLSFLSLPPSQRGKPYKLQTRVISCLL